MIECISDFILHLIKDIRSFLKEKYYYSSIKKIDVIDYLYLNT